MKMLRLSLILFCATPFGIQEGGVRKMIMVADDTALPGTGHLRAVRPRAYFA
jgi:hypothetical protein